MIFSNFQHFDYDKISYAFGCWWVAKVPAQIGKKYELVCEDDNQAHIQGGGFLWGQYGIGIDFERWAYKLEIYFLINVM